MPAVAIIGAQWGDEGKGKVIDFLAEKAHMVVRFSGGNNAGHTVINDLGHFRMHLVPSGIFHPQVTCLIGNGVVVDPAALLEEMEQLKKARIDLSQLFLSDRAHLIMPYHLLLDELEERARGGGALGTTKKGIGPAYADKVARLGLRAGDLLDKEAFLLRLRPVLEYKNNLLTKVYGVEALSLEEVYSKYCHYGECLAPYIKETDLLLQGALERGETALLEGAQGTLLDLDFGTYPYVTSSSPMVGGACSGLGLSPAQISGVIGVYKAYNTRVGNGPMPTELHDEKGLLLRERGQEYGTTTGRPRRCGWFDAVLGRFSCRLNGFTSAALTRLDVLDAFPSLKICTSYKIDDVTYAHPPSNLRLLERCQPVYEELPGWQKSISGVHRLRDLPKEAQAYIRRLEELTGCPVSLVSVGASREQTIVVRPLP